MRIFLIILLLLKCFIAGAQQNSGLEMDSVSTIEIIVESNRLKTTNALAPNKIQLFDEKFISAVNGSRLSDLLDQSDAVFVKNYGFNSGIKVISLNATQSEHTLILLDGVKLNSRQNSQFDLSLYDLDNVTKIELSSGGSSALYGSEAIGGVVNIKTKVIDSSKRLEAQIKSTLGSYGLRRFYGRFTNQFNIKEDNKLSYSISYSDERAKNNFEYYFKNGLSKVLKERENSDFNTQSFYFDATLSGRSSALKLFTYYTHFERGVPGIESGYAPGTARQIDYNSVSSVSFSKKFGKKIDFKSDIDYKYSLQKYFDPATFNLSVKINSFYKLNSYTNNTTIGFTPSNNFSLESGCEISYNSIYSNDTEEGKLLQGAIFTSGKGELYPGVISKISIFPSIRYDYFSNIKQKNVVTGKLGINIKPFLNENFTLKSSFGNNFGAPTFNELFWKDIGNKDLKPERSTSFDAGVFYWFKIFFVNELEISYFNIMTTDRIVWTPVSGSIWRPLNIGKVKSEGIDISLKLSLAELKHLYASISLNYTYGTALKRNEDYPGDLSYNKQLLYLPKEMFKSVFMFNYLTTSKFLKLVSFSLFYNYYTRRYINPENTEFVSRFDVLDGNFGVNMVISGIDVNLKFCLNNIFNEDYQVVSGYPMPLRNYKFEIGFKY